MVLAEWARGAVVEDLFGRDASVFGLVVPDWEGYMANPAIEFHVSAPPEAVSPTKVELKCDDPRLYFDLPSTAGEHGPAKQLTITGQPVTAHIAVFPARKKKNADRTLQISMSDEGGHKWSAAIVIHEIAVGSKDHSPNYPILLDFSQDTMGFYRDADHRAAIQQAAADWAFYLADLHEQRVERQNEMTGIWDTDGFVHAHFITNAAPYTGTLLYTYGINGPEHRSGGDPSSAGKPQIANGRALPLRRSGEVVVQIDGNFNTLGWAKPITDEQWWKATNLGVVQNDLYSVVHHEMGHALFFNPTISSFRRDGKLRDSYLAGYYGSDPTTDIHDHFPKTIDPESLRGVFGNEYNGRTPYGRWLITKFDLLAAHAVGYQLPRTAPFLPLKIETTSLPRAQVGKPYHASLAASGGIPFYDWQIAAGSSLPDGITLNRFTGEISGTAQRPGPYPLKVEVRDYHHDGSPVSRSINFAVGRGR
jgi:hypothetical protein